jgi:hypothetical protein
MANEAENEFLPDAWERFERAVDVVSKSGPMHRTASRAPTPPTLMLGYAPELEEAIEFLYSGPGSSLDIDIEGLRERHLSVLREAICRAESLRVPEGGQTLPRSQSQTADHSDQIQYCIGRMAPARFP